MELQTPGAGLEGAKKINSLSDIEIKNDSSLVREFERMREFTQALEEVSEILIKRISPVLTEEKVEPEETEGAGRTLYGTCEVARGLWGNNEKLVKMLEKLQNAVNRVEL